MKFCVKYEKNKQRSEVQSKEFESPFENLPSAFTHEVNMRTCLHPIVRIYDASSASSL